MFLKPSKLLTLSHSQRQLLCDRIYNARDLGGLTGHGFMLNYGFLLRGESGANSTQEDHRYLLEYGVKHIFDLRTIEEAEMVGHGALNQYKIHSHPLVKGDTFKNNSATKVSRLVEYQQYYTRSHSIVRELVQLLNSNSGAVYIHCAVGKDRTGVMTAILLKLLGIDDRDIVNDYLESKHHIKPIIENLATYPIYSDFQNVNWVLQEPLEANILPLLESLRTPEQRTIYLNQAKIDLQEIASLRKLLLRALS